MTHTHAGRADKETDPGAWVEFNWRFHSLLERASRSPRLQSLVSTAQGATAQYVGYSMKVHPSRMAEGNAEHRALLKALASGNAAQAEQVLLQHLNRTMDVVLAAEGNHKVTAEPAPRNRRKPARMYSGAE